MCRPTIRPSILIEDNKIVEVGRAADVKIPPDATVDRHQRPDDAAGPDGPPCAPDAPRARRLRRWFPWIAKNGVERVMEISAKQLLMAGVTTAVDLSGAAEGKPARSATGSTAARSPAPAC